MSEDADEQAREDAIRQMLDPGWRVPTVAEVEAMRSRFGLSRVPVYNIRVDLAQATIFYHRYLNPPTPNAQDDRLRDIQAKVNALINALGDGVLHVVIGESVSWPEPPGLRKMLYQLRDNVQGGLEAIDPYVDRSKKQTQGWKKGLRPFIFHLHQILSRYLGRPPRAFDRSGSIYKSAEFFDFIVEACKVCGIHHSESQIGDEIRRLCKDGVIPRGEKRVKNPKIQANLNRF